MTIGTCRCGARWSGQRPEHCTACHRTYSGNTLGDDHRVGEFSDGTRRCLTPDEMTAKGWRLVGEIWRGPAMPKDVLARKIGSKA